MKLQGGNRVCLNMIEGNEQRTVAESFFQIWQILKTQIWKPKECKLLFMSNFCILRISLFGIQQWFSYFEKEWDTSRNVSRKDTKDNLAYGVIDELIDLRPGFICEYFTWNTILQN